MAYCRSKVEAEWESLEDGRGGGGLSRKRERNLCTRLRCLFGMLADQGHQGSKGKLLVLWFCDLSPLFDSNIRKMQADDLSTIEDDTRGLDTSPKAHLSEGIALAEELVGKCHDLLGELEAFQEYLVHSDRGHNIELKPFKNSVAAELRSLEKVIDVPWNAVFVSLPDGWCRSCKEFIRYTLY